MNENTKIKLHILSSDTIDQDISLMQIPNPEYDSLVETSPTNSEYVNILIDSGATNSSEEHIAKLSTLGVTKINGIIITHYDENHIGGLYAICNAFDLTNATIYLPAQPPSNYTPAGILFSNVREIAIENNMTQIYPTSTNHTFNIEKLTLEFKNYDPAGYYNADGSIENYDDTCLCCVMTYGKTRIGLFGDIGLKAQKSLANTIGHLDLMSVENHGMNSGYYRPFFDSIAPQMCFTQNGSTVNGGIKDGVNYLAERCKTQAYLQKNGIPNFATSVNDDITFDIYETGISTKASAIKYANGIKGVTSYLGAMNNSISAHNINTNLISLLKNMEHGTFLSTMIIKNEPSSPYSLWTSLLDGLVDSDVEKAQLILYKGGSSITNQSENAAIYPDSGYIMIIPHAEATLQGPIYCSWKAEKNYNAININLKPLSRIEHFKFVKNSSASSLLGNDRYPYNTNVLEQNNSIESDGLRIYAKEKCLINYTILLWNNKTDDMIVKFYDGETSRTVTVKANSYVTINNMCTLEKDDYISAPTSALYVRITGYVTSTNPNAKTISQSSADLIADFLPYNEYPLF